MGETMKLGFIGLGRMGGNMVLNLMDKKHKVIVYNRSPGKMKPVVRKGAIPSYSLKELVKELPKQLFGCHLQIDRTDIAYYVWYVPIGSDIDKRPKDFVAGNTDEKLCNALSKKWLYLKKEGYIIENNTNQEINNWENEGGR